MVSKSVECAKKPAHLVLLQKLNFLSIPVTLPWCCIPEGTNPEDFHPEGIRDPAYRALHASFTMLLDILHEMVIPEDARPFVVEILQGHLETPLIHDVRVSTQVRAIIAELTASSIE